MAVEDRLGIVNQHIEKARRYVRLIVGNSFSSVTLDELKANAKDRCDDAKDELDLAKDEIDELQ